MLRASSRRVVALIIALALAAVSAAPAEAFGGPISRAEVRWDDDELGNWAVSVLLSRETEDVCAGDHATRVDVQVSEPDGGQGRVFHLSGVVCTDTPMYGPSGGGMRQMTRFETARRPQRHLFLRPAARPSRMRGRLIVNPTGGSSWAGFRITFTGTWHGHQIGIAIWSVMASNHPPY